MAIRIMKKYTDENTDFEAIDGLYSSCTIEIKPDGSVSQTEPIFLGYKGEDRVRVINFDTRTLKWGKLDATNTTDEEGELKDFYEPRVVVYNEARPRSFYQKDESGMPILTATGDYILVDTEGKDITNENGTRATDTIPNPFMVRVEKNWCYLPNEITHYVGEYKMVYALIEKTDNDDQGNIKDCAHLNKEVFISSEFYGYVADSAKDLFAKHTGDYYVYTCENGVDENVATTFKGENSLHKTRVKLLNLDGNLVRPIEEPTEEEQEPENNKEVKLGHKGDSYITPLDFTLKTATDLDKTEEDLAARLEKYRFEILFYREDQEEFVVEKGTILPDLYETQEEHPKESGPRPAPWSAREGEPTQPEDETETEGDETEGEEPETPVEPEIEYETVIQTTYTTYLVKPEAVRRKEKTIQLRCWVPREVTQTSTNISPWKVATHFWTVQEPILEAYSTAIDGLVEETFLTKGVENSQVDTTLALYEINPENENALIIASDHDIEQADYSNTDEIVEIYKCTTKENDDGTLTVDLGIHQI